MSTPATQTGLSPEDVALLKGGPHDPNSEIARAHAAHIAKETGQPAPETPPAAAGEPAATEPPPKKYKVGTREFDTPEEIAAYALALEDHVRPNAPPAQPAQPQQELIDGRPIDLVMFDEPLKYHNYVVEKATTKAREQLQEVNRQSQNEAAFWSDFYRQNPDLKDEDDTVRSEMQRNYVELAEVSKANPDAAKKKLATYARGHIDGILKRRNVTTTDAPASGGASILGVSGGSAPRPTKAPEKPKTFKEQVQALRRRA